MARLVNGQTGDLKNALGLAGAMRNPTGALSNAVMEKLKNHPLYAQASQIAAQYGGDWNRAFEETAKANGIDPNPNVYNGIRYFSRALSAGGVRGLGNSLCSALRYSGGLSASNGFYMNSDRGPLIIHLADQSADTTAKFNAWAEEIGLQVVCKLASPVAYRLTPAQLATLRGYNSVSANVGTIELTYRADVALSLEDFA